MDVEFDPAKDAANIAKHGISLARARELDILAFVTTMAASTKLAIGYTG